jgi:hypothetical protein
MNEGRNIIKKHEAPAKSPIVNNSNNIWTPPQNEASTFEIKWGAKEAEVLMPDQSLFKLDLPPTGLNARVVVRELCNRFRLEPWEDYQLYYRSCFLTSAHIVPGVQYKLVKK